jgi:chloramphenicol 3-O-phosphotransferase
VPGIPISLDQALDLTRTGDVWLFRGRTMADRAIQVTTNSPVNHVGMSVVVEDLPPLMWHAELGRSVPDVWSGTHQRGAQLHDLREAVVVWAARYGQRAWLRQLDHPVTR